MIPLQHYLGATKELKPGQQMNIDHKDCSAGRDTKRRLYIKRKNDDTIVAYCHNCGQAGVHSNRSRVRAIHELIAAKLHDEEHGLGEMVLPSDVVLVPEHWPASAQAWVGKYGITFDECVQNELCYSPSWDRVILPVYEDGKLVFWQGRAVEPGGLRPKYISAKAHPKVMAHKHFIFESTRVFIVEDMLSAIKMSRYVDCIALLGTSADFSCLREKLDNYHKVGIALDPDLAGQQKSRELAARLRLSFKGRVWRPNVVQQPKEMSDETLRALVSGL